MPAVLNSSAASAMPVMSNPTLIVWKREPKCSVYEGQRPGDSHWQST